MFATITLACCLATLTLFGIAAWTDRTKRRIANRISAGVIALFALWIMAGYALEGRLVVPLLSHLVAATGVFIVSYALWAARMFGGGDVKILTSVALWAGTADLAPVILLITLSGAIMAVVLLTLNHFLPHTAQTLFGPVHSETTASDDDAADCTDIAEKFEASATDVARPTLPYGIAIVIGGSWMMAQIMLQYGIV